MTINLIATLHAAPAVHERIKADMNQLVPLSRAEPGCLQYDFYAINQEGAPGIDNTGGDFVVIEKWQDGEALQQHGASQHFQAFMTAYTPEQLRLTVQVLAEAV